MYLCAALCSKTFAYQTVSWIISSAIIAMALSQFSNGAFIDSFGTKNVLFICLIVFTLSSGLLFLFRNNYFVVIALSIIQSFGASCFVVSSLTIIKRRFDKNVIFRYTAFVNGLFVLFFLCPIFGAYVLYYTGWKGLFLPYFILGIIGIVLVLFGLEQRELPKNRPVLKISNIINGNLSVMKGLYFYCFSLLFLISFLITLLYVMSIPIIAVQMHKKSILTVPYILKLNEKTRTNIEI